MQLAGKKALITGARRNIGRGIAQALAEAGCDVGINDIEQDTDADETLRLVEELGRESAFFRADLVKSGEIETMFKAFLKRFGKIDILVNNAYYTEHKPFLELTEEDWDQTLDVSLKSFFLCGQHAARAMVERENEGCKVGAHLLICLIEYLICGRQFLSLSGGRQQHSRTVDASVQIQDDVEIATHICTVDNPDPSWWFQRCQSFLEQSQFIEASNKA